MARTMSNGVIAGGVVIEAGTTYLGGQTLAPNTQSTAATLPAGTTTICISAEGGPVYYRVNGTSASADAPGYVPEDGWRVVLGVANLTALHVYAAADVKAHLEYYRD